MVGSSLNTNIESQGKETQGSADAGINMPAMGRVFRLSEHTAESIQPSRRDMLIAVASFVAGSAALAGITLNATQIHEVSAHELSQYPEKFEGKWVQTHCTLHARGEGALSFDGESIGAPGSGEFTKVSQALRLFGVNGEQSERFHVAAADGDAALIVGQALRIEGVISEALLDGKQVYVLLPRAVSLAPIPGPVVPF
jgi:hypothetical protein